MQRHTDTRYSGIRLVLTRDEVAEMLGVSPRSVARFVERHELPVVRLGRLARYRFADVEALLESHLEDHEPARDGLEGKTTRDAGARYDR